MIGSKLLIAATLLVLLAAAVPVRAVSLLGQNSDYFPELDPPELRPIEFPELHPERYGPDYGPSATPGAPSPAVQPQPPRTGVRTRRPASVPRKPTGRRRSLRQ